MSTKRIIVTLAILCCLALALTAQAADVSDAIESTWKAAAGQIKTVVNNVVFPAIDLILAVLFFVKLSVCYMDCAPVSAM